MVAVPKFGDSGWHRLLVVEKVPPRYSCVCVCKSIWRNFAVAAYIGAGAGASARREG